MTQNFGPRNDLVLMFHGLVSMSDILLAIVVVQVKDSNSGSVGLSSDLVPDL